jgi:hypothetical protein
VDRAGDGEELNCVFRSWSRGQFLVAGSIQIAIAKIGLSAANEADACVSEVLGAHFNAPLSTIALPQTPRWQEIRK